MTHTVPREHFNLYYIFEEDKQNNMLPETKVDILRQNIFKNFPADP